MSEEIAIRSVDLSKAYVLRHAVRHDTLRDALAERGRRIWLGLWRRGGEGRDSETFWALRDVSFDVKRGEVVGVIGRNGAGKSTLLKMLSRITQPTSGRAEIRGRVASLLEVGTGFHPELTGRENIFLNGAILGMRRAEIHRTFDDIVAFAEVERFLDTPVKRYSSGMYVRLAFAVAAHLEPEILIVDEVLAVGDVEFQKKCLGKMSEVSSRFGRTVLFVSHNLAAVSGLAPRSLWIDQGGLRADGRTSDVITSYLADSRELGPEYVARAAPRRPYVSAIRVRTSESGGVQAAGKPMAVSVEIDHRQAQPFRPCISFQVVNQFGYPATHLWYFAEGEPYGRKPGTTTLTCRIPKVRLNVGRYTLKLYFTEPPGGKAYETLEHVCAFEVIRLEDTLWGWRAETSTYHEDHTWEVESHPDDRRVTDAHLGSAPAGASDL